MSEQVDPKFSRLLREGSSLEKEVLGSALKDAPAPERRRAVIEQVMSGSSRRERPRLWLLPSAITAVCAAAATALVLRSPAPHPTLPVSAEPPTQDTGPVASKPLAPLTSSTKTVDGFVPCTPVSVADGLSPLIDDFEDGNTRMPLLEHRAGDWVIFNDGTNTQQPRPGSLFPAVKLDGRGDSHFGLHMFGGRFAKWGATLAIELSPRRCYDASVYSGIEFWARGRGSIRPTVKMTQIVSEEFGGSCLHDCFDAHGVNVTLARDWQKFHLAWADLKQHGFGEKLPLDARSLFSIEFEVAPEQTPFDFWIDDVSFWK